MHQGLGFSATAQQARSTWVRLSLYLWLSCATDVVCVIALSDKLFVLHLKMRFISLKICIILLVIGGNGCVGGTTAASAGGGGGYYGGGGG